MHSEKTLKQALDEANTFIDGCKNEPTSYVENTVLVPLRELAFQAAAAAIADSETQQRYVAAVENLRDICIEVGHPNTLKEEPLYRRIKNQFPAFINPLRLDA